VVVLFIGSFEVIGALNQITSCKVYSSGFAFSCRS